MVVEPEKKLIPEKELTQEKYVWRVYDEKDTGLRLLTLEDTLTGFVLCSANPNPSKRTASLRAWAGARHSRAPGTTEKIMHEMGEKGIDPDQKLEETFRGYGHASVADMARFEVHFNNVPMHVPFLIFNYGTINSGQEKSTRYQNRFGNNSLHGLAHYLPDVPEEKLLKLEILYQELGNRSLEIFNGHKGPITEGFENFYKPKSKKEKSSLDSRVLDTIRSSLLLGQGTGFCFETSARDWSRLIAHLKVSSVPVYGKLASQLELLLAPPEPVEEEMGFKAETPSLIRHTESDETVKKNLERLGEYLLNETSIIEDVFAFVPFSNTRKQKAELIPGKYSSAQKMVGQYISTLLVTDCYYIPLLEWVASRDEETQKKISRMIYEGHSHHRELPVQLARITDISLKFTCSLGEARDFNRHRAWGRFIQWPSVFAGQQMDFYDAESILMSGRILPSYLEKIPEFSSLRESFNNDLDAYYKKLEDFLSDAEKELGQKANYSFVLNLLPLAHAVNLHMHGDPKQADYLGKLRVRPGGHINYRELAYEASKLIANSDPYLSAMALDSKPDPANREEFFSRA